MLKSYWWGSSLEEGLGATLVSMGSLCYGKEEGGLGFRDFWCFNLAMLGFVVEREDST